jgi:MoxR-like ATPase
VFTNVLLADEINRTTPKTQSALLEAMDERQVSVDGHTYPLTDPFLVIATQNPQDFYGTYPLPESQLDRFMLRIRIGYPPADVERRVLRTRRGADPLRDVEPVVTREELLGAQEAVRTVRVDDVLIDYLHAMVVATRESSLLELGASTRAALDLTLAVRAHAIVTGRAYAIPDDVKELAPQVLSHRVRVTGLDNGAGGRVDAERVLRDIVSTLSVPV